MLYIKNEIKNFKKIKLGQSMHFYIGHTGTHDTLRYVRNVKYAIN